MDVPLVERAQESATHTTDAQAVRAAQGVLLPAVAGASLEQTATVIGVRRPAATRL